MNDIETKKTSLLIRYLAVLQEGRVKPDKHNNLTHVRDSMENVDLMRRVKEKINNQLDISHKL